MKRPTPLRPDRWGWSFDGVHGQVVGPTELSTARVCRIVELERYAEHLEQLASERDRLLIKVDSLEHELRAQKWLALTIA